MLADILLFAQYDVHKSGEVCRAYRVFTAGSEAFRYL